MRLSMLKTNPLQFSVVREDPEIEVSVFRKFRVQKPILIGSGGCTILCLASEFPKMNIFYIEPNPAQVRLIQGKIKCLGSLDKSSILKKFGVGRADEDSLSLIEQGNFESLFRSLRQFLFKFVADKIYFRKLFLKGTDKEWKQVFSHPYWPVAFDLHFSNSILLAMFGSAAIQHAPSQSYSAYFKEALESGILREDRRTNYFLHHIFLGQYLNQKSAWPMYLRRLPEEIKTNAFVCRIQEVDDLSSFDFVGLSNIFDWSSEREIKTITSKLDREMKPGSTVLFRQLNNRKNFKTHFSGNYEWYPRDEKMLHRGDRSLFYSSINLGRKMK